MQRPLTDRLLLRLPGPSWAWAVLLVVVIALRTPTLAGVLTVMGEHDLAAEILADNLLPNVVLALVVAIALAGVWVLGARARAAAAAVAELTAGPPDQPHSPIRGLGSTGGPLALAVLIMAAFKLPQLQPYPLAMHLADLPFIVLITVPAATFLWVYGAVLVSVDRLGREALSLRAFPEDRWLGLRPIGNLVFTGFSFYMAAVVPFLIAWGSDLVELLIGLTILAFGTAVFVLSMWRLHVQMAAVKRHHVAAARALYLEAYEPLRTDHSLTTLDAQAGRLRAAEALEKRAESILEWPIDERTIARVTVIVTGVTTGLILRFVLDALGR